MEIETEIYPAYEGLDRGDEANRKLAAFGNREITSQTPQRLSNKDTPSRRRPYFKKGMSILGITKNA